MPITCYPGFLPGLPDLVVGRWPPEIPRTGPDRWKAWFVETPSEREALDTALARPVPRASGALNFRDGPDAATSSTSVGDIFIALYLPPEAGWPWLTVVSTPGNPDGARQRYTWDADMTESAALDRVARLRAMAPSAPVRIPDRARMS